MGFSRQEYWSGLPFSSLEDLPDPEIKPTSLTSHTLAGRFFTTSAARETHTLHEVKVLVAQSCLTLCDPMDCSPPGSSVMEFSRQEYCSGLPFSSLEDLPDSGIESMFPASPALQTDSLPLNQWGSL